MFFKRRILNYFFGYKIHPKAYIGFSYIFPDKLTMGKNSYIGHFNTAVNLDEIIIGEEVSVARGNWITGFSSKKVSKHFNHQTGRRSVLVIDDHSAITKNHHIDCTSAIHIGKFTTIAGYNSQLLTHSINVYENRQDSHPITIGDYVFVSTGVVILGGARIPSYSILGAKSMLNKPFTEEWVLYGGNPAKPIKNIDKSALYFNRQIGFVC